MPSEPPDFSTDFHDFEGAVYLNCAYHGAMPRVATEAVEQALELKRTPHLIRDADHFDYADGFRQAVARLIDAESSDIAVTSSATSGVMILSAGLRWRSGDEVVLPAGEFPANLFPWRALEAQGVVIREVALEPHEDPVVALVSAITDRTRVVAVSWVSYSTGRRIDVKRLGERCRAARVLLAIDASQAVGAIPFSVRDVPCDLVAAAGYKWMLCPYGTGFAWVNPDLCEVLTPHNVNWFSLEGARDFGRLSECTLEFEPGARRFDMNEPGNFLNMAGATAAVRYLTDVTPEVAHGHAQALLDRIVAGLPAAYRVARPANEPRSNILCLEYDEAPEALADRLASGEIFLSHREGRLRISPHLYNRPSDVDRLLAAL
jgi:selenocysteine lyase/cysteine desulfurase